MNRKTASRVAAVCILMSLAALAGGDTVVLGYTGQTAPDGNGTYTTFRDPVLNAFGRIAYKGYLTGTIGGSYDDSAIFRAEAGGVTIVCREGQLTPNGNGWFQSLYDPAMNNASQLAFRADATNTFLGPYDAFGLYRGSGGAITRIFRGPEPAPDGNGRFLLTHHEVLFDDNVATQVRASFTGTSGGYEDDTGIVVNGWGLTYMYAREGQWVPGGNGRFTGFRQLAADKYINVVFLGDMRDTSAGKDNNTAIFRAAPSYPGANLLELVREGDAPPDGNGEFSSFRLSPTLSDVTYDRIGFHAWLRNTSGGVHDDSGIFLAMNTGVIRLAREGQSPPDGNGQYMNFDSDIAQNDASVAFRAFMGGTAGGPVDEEGVYRSNGFTTRKIVRGGEPAPDGNGVFRSVYNIVMNKENHVAFSASLVGTSSGSSDNRGLFIGNGYDTVQVARKGDPLLGSTIAELHLAEGPDCRNGLNRHAQLAYRADLADGREALVLFTPELEWKGGNGPWYAKDNWTLKIAPKAMYDASITPPGDVEVDGPTVNVTVKSLTIGSTGGLATLNLSYGGDLTAVGSLTLTHGGKVQIGAGRTLSAANLVNAGILAFQRGQAYVLGDVANMPEGRILVPAGAEVWLQGRVGNQGVVDVAPGAGFHALGLTGNGSTGTGTVWLEADVWPGAGIGQMAFGGDVVFGRRCVTHLELGGRGLLPEYDEILVAGDLLLDGSLHLEFGAAPPPWLAPGQRLEIIDVVGTAAGAFLGLAEGAEVDVLDGLPVHITYAGGDGNDVELYVVPEPSMLVLAAMGLLASGWRRRRNPARSAPVVTVVMLSVGAGLLLCALPAPAEAEIYHFTEIANDQGPPFDYFGTAYHPSINESGMVAFHAFLDGGEKGIFVGDGATPSTITTTSGVFSGLSIPSINNAGDVAFRAKFGDYYIVRFDAASSAFTPIADTTGPFDDFAESVSINNVGTVAFRGALDIGGTAIAVGSGGSLSMLASADYTSQLGPPVISTGGPDTDVAFYSRSGSSGHSFIYKFGTHSPVVVATTWGDYATLSSKPSINDAGQVLFSAWMDSGVRGVYAGDGYSTTTVADSVGPFDGFYDVAHSNTGSAFRASLDAGTGSGIYTGPNVSTDKVIASGDILQGCPTTVKNVSIGPEALNNSRQLVMHVDFHDGSRIILRADPFGEQMAVPEGLNAVSAIKSWWQAGLGRAIDNASEQADLGFRYRFATTTGQLLVTLGDVTVATVTAPRTLSHDFTTVEIPVDVLSLFPDLPPTLELEFILEGGGELSGVLIDDITFPGLLNGDFGTGDLRGWEIDAPPGSAVGVAAPIPEPATLALAAMGLLAFGWRRRRNPARSAPVVTVVMLSVGAGLLLCALPAPAEAEIYHFTEIANNQGQPFDSFDSYMPPSINESGKVAFFTYLDGGEVGIFVGDGAPASKIVDTSVVFTGLSTPSINDAGDVAFRAKLSDYQIVRYDAASSAFTTIADKTGPFNGFGANVSINNAGTVAFRASLDTGGSAIAVGIGGPPGFLASAPNLSFQSLGTTPVISTGGSILDVAYWAERPSGVQTIIKGGSLSPVTVATTSGPFSALYRPSINDASQVLFTATLDAGGSGVYVGDGSSITTIADSVGPFDTFYTVAHSNTGSAFRATLDIGTDNGVFTGPNPTNDKVIVTGHSLQGFPATVLNVHIGPEGLNNSRQLAMLVYFQDGRYSVVRADPFGELIAVPEGLNAAVAIKTWWQAALAQVIDNASEQADLAFRYRFATTTGQLLVTLGDVTLTTVTAPRTLSHDFATVEIPVDVLSLFPDLPPTLELEFILEGGGELSGVLIDDITFPGLLNGDFGTGDLRGWEIDAPPGSAVGVAAPIPEPATLTLLAMGALALIRRRRAKGD